MAENSLPVKPPDELPAGPTMTVARLREALCELDGGTPIHIMYHDSEWGEWWTLPLETVRIVLQEHHDGQLDTSVILILDNR